MAKPGSCNTVRVHVKTPRAMQATFGSIEIVPTRQALRAPQRAEGFGDLRVARHRLEQLQRASSGLVIAVTSARPSEGAALLARQMAWVFSEAERATTVLVEATFERASLAQAFHVEVPPTVSLPNQIENRLAGALAPWRLLDLGGRLHAALVRPGEGSFPGTLQSAHFRHFIATLARTYQRVVLVAPPVLGGSDANAVLQLADGVILAAREGATTRTDLREAALAIGAQLTGLVLVARAD